MCLAFLFALLHPSFPCMMHYELTAIIFLTPLFFFPRIPFFCCPSAILSHFIIFSYCFFLSIFHSFSHLSWSPLRSTHRSPSAHPSTAINNCLCHRSAQPKPMRSGQTHPSHMLRTNTRSPRISSRPYMHLPVNSSCISWVRQRACRLMVIVTAYPRCCAFATIGCECV